MGDFNLNNEELHMSNTDKNESTVNTPVPDIKIDIKQEPDGFMDRITEYIHYVLFDSDQAYEDANRDPEYLKIVGEHSTILSKVQGVNSIRVNQLKKALLAANNHIAALGNRHRVEITKLEKEIAELKTSNKTKIPGFFKGLLYIVILFLIAVGVLFVLAKIDSEAMKSIKDVLGLFVNFANNTTKHIPTN